MKRLAIIPARSGSKGLKDKNIIELCGKPLLAYTVEAAVQSRLFELVIVSTDSERYAKIAAYYGAQILLRGEALSDDKATSYMVIEDVLSRTEEQYDYFVLLQPTSPMRTVKHIAEAVAKFDERYGEFDFLVSMKEAEFAKPLVNSIDEDESLKFFNTDFSAYRRQQYRDYVPNGAIFIGKCEAYLKKKHFFGSKSVSYMMNRIDSIDIDDSVDYELACLLMKKRLAHE